MANATQGTVQISRSYDSSGKRHFIMPYTCNNYNDVNVVCAPSNDIWDVMDSADREQVLIVTNIEILHLGTIGVELTYISLFTGKVVGTYLPHHTTTKAIDVHAITDINAWIDTRDLRLGDAWLMVWPSGYAAGDDMQIFIRGYIMNTEASTTQTAQPVAVKKIEVWPWQRG